ncbi:HutD/Ves family protein [Marinomonas transparens]|uniref:HutD family protein n=1 Tax=Marinomonas transparens TaxID=2795388 RepID=A0A934N0L3_9GAMM|nr:HutD family protein [Marinomonas transparens]MBJ7538675.1 HutD family protein [Marinomonas transparens]
MTLNSNAYSNSNYDILCPREYKRMLWKNGLGETLEIFQSEDGSGQRFRISQAAVKEDGLFSNFEGMHRTLVLLSGAGMTLSHKNAQGEYTEHRLSSPLDMARFSGGDQTTATLSHGHIEDLNIMVREADTTAIVTACFATENSKLKSAAHSLLSAFYSNQTCKVMIDETEEWVLEENSLLIIKQGETPCLIEGSGVFICITA